MEKFYQRKTKGVCNNIENEYEEKTILVTGGAGCTGTNLCRKLAESGARKVIILDDLSGAYEWSIPKAKSIVFVKPDYVFHLAAHFANQSNLSKRFNPN